MKNLFLIIALGVNSIVFSQTEPKIYGDVQIGAGMTAQGRGMYNLSGGFNAVLKNDFYFRLGADFAFGGSYKNANALVNYNQYSIRLGFNNEISEKFAIRPYVGVGYMMGTATTRNRNAAADAANEVASLLGKTVDTRYIGEKVNSLSAPIGVDFHLHGNNVGFVTGLYMNISNYSEVGVRVGITFGKL